MNITAIIAYKSNRAGQFAPKRLKVFLKWLQGSGFLDGKEFSINEAENGILLHISGDAKINVNLFSDSDDFCFSTTTPMISTRHVQHLSGYEKEIRNAIRNGFTLSRYLSPFFLSFRDKDTLGVATDPLGFGRAYCYEDQDILVSSNHIGLCSAFGTGFVEDREAWLGFAAFGWFNYNLSPFSQVKRLEPGIKISVTDAIVKKQTYFDYGSLFVSEDREVLKKDTLTELKTSIYNVSRISREPLNVMLSGGKDSRLTAAAVLSSGADCIVQTINTLQEEVTVAKSLMMAADRKNLHRITQPGESKKVGSLSQSIQKRSENCMLIWDGDFNPNQLSRNTGFNTPKKFTVSGGGGEIAHGNYYSSTELLARIEQLSDPTDWLRRYFSNTKGVRQEASLFVDGLFDHISEKMTRYGVSGASVLDGFYLIERYRRWIAAGHRSMSLVPYASISFVRLSMSLTPSERLHNKIHIELTSRLIPEWSGIPYFKGKPSGVDERSKKGLRIWQGEHREEFFDLVETAKTNSIWDRQQIDGMLNELSSGNGNGLLEGSFQRILWTHSFSEHQKKMKDFFRNLGDDRSDGTHAV